MLAGCWEIDSDSCQTQKRLVNGGDGNAGLPFLADYQAF